MANYTPTTAKPIINGETRMADLDLYYAKVAMANALNVIEQQIRTNKECGHTIFTAEDALNSALAFLGSYVREA